MELTAGRVIDRYVVDGPLGKGGMASVFRARHTTLGTRHALKVLHAASPSIRARLLQEGRVQASLRHPCVVSVSDVIDVDGSPGLVMEFVEGPSLEQWLAAVQPSLAQIDALALDILDGITAAHKLGLVHRDLKPGNVMLCVVDGRVRAKITDFGLAKVLAGDVAGAVHTRTGATMGTPAYMAPEQIRDAASVDARADVYALGALLYELATGRRAFDGDDVLDIFDRIRRGAYEPLSKVAPELPARLSHAIDGALRPDANERWPDVDHLRAAWTEGGRVVADPAAFSAVLVDRTLSMAPSVVDSTVPASGSDSTATFATSEVGSPLRVAAPAPPPSMGPPSTSAIPLPSAGPSQAPVEATRGSRRLAFAGLGVVGFALVGVVGVGVMSLRSTRPAVPGLAGVPALPGASAEVDEAWQEGWKALLGTEFHTARRRFERVTTDVDDARVWAALGLACGYEGDVGCFKDSAAKAAAGAEGADAEFARLASAGLTDAGDPAPWNVYLDAHPDDLLVALWSQEVVLVDLDVRMAPFDGPDAPPVVAFARANSALYAQNMPLDEAGVLLDAAIARRPDVPALHAQKGNVALTKGDFPAARDELKRALDDDPGLTWVWPAYGAALRLTGDTASAERITAQATAPEQPLPSRLLFWRQMAYVEAGRGHRAEALRLTAAADAAAVEADDWTSAVGVRGDGVLYAQLFETGAVEAAAAWRDAAAAPEISVAMRDKMQRVMVVKDGVLAAQRGDVPAAEAALARAEKLGSSPTGLLGLKRAIAIARHDAAALDALPLAETDGSCVAPIGEGLDRLLAGDAAAAIPWLERGLGGTQPCAAWGVPTAWRVRAYAALAEAHASRGETDLSREDVASARALWPDPDPDLPIVARLSALAP